MRLVAEGGLLVVESGRIAAKLSIPISMGTLSKLSIG
jgi:hypothetical protein